MDLFIFSSKNCRLGVLNSFHSVISINASHESTASYLFETKGIFERHSSGIARLNSSVACASYALILAPSLLISSYATTSDVASLTSSVPGLKASPQMANVSSVRSSPNLSTILFTRTIFCLLFTFST